MSVWGKPAGGAWADNVDEEEAAAAAAPAPAFPKLGKAVEDDFPDLAAAAKVKESKKDKKKKQTLSLNDFLKSGGGGAAAPAFGSAFGSRRGGGDVDLLSLPTAPRPRGEGEERSDRPLGGGFREYGGREGGRGRYGDDDRPRRDDDEDMGPSRAEASDNWGADRKFTPGGDDRGRGGFGGGFRDGGFRDRSPRGGGGFRDRSRDAPLDGPSRADEVDDWGKTKAFVPSAGGSRGFADRSPGGGYRDRSPAAFREPSRADTEDRWSKAGGADFKPTAFEDRPRREFDDRGPPRRFGFGDRPGSREPSRDRWERAPRDGSRDGRALSRDISQERTWRRGDAPPGSAGDAPARGRPKLNLAPRSAAPPPAAPGAKASSVFGAARPREEVLAEQGRDAVKEDLALEHEAVGRPESAEEAELRKRIADLQIRVEAGEADAECDVGEAPGGGEAGSGGAEEDEAAPSRTVAQALADAEAALQRLQLELDDRAKYARAAGAAGAEERGRDRAPRARDPSPAAQGGWRRTDNGAEPPGPRGFRDDRPARAGGYEERAPRGRAGDERGGEERRRDGFPPRDRDASRDDKPRW